MTRMTDDQEKRRAVIEDVLAALSARVMCDVAALRVRQAMERDRRLGELLSPVIEHIERSERAMSMASDVLGEVWRRHDKQGW